MLKVPATPLPTLINARNIAMKAGVRYAYTGNVHHKQGDSTFCHQCGGKVIGRDGYQLREWHLDAHGNCQNCGGACTGLFEPRPGDWGAKRIRVMPH